MPTPRRIADNQVLGLDGYPLPLVALKLGVGNVVAATGAASSAAIALPGTGAGASNVYLLLAGGPMAIIFGLAGVGAAVADATSFNIPAAGSYLIDPGVLATHFRHIQVVGAQTFQLIAVPTQA